MTDQAKLVEELRTYPWGVDDTPEGPRLLKRAADLLASKDGEINRLKDRLEMTTAWQAGPDGELVEVPAPDGMPDGIECRDETIRLLEALTLSLRAENERLRGALEPFAKFDTDGFSGVVLEVVPSTPDNPSRRIEPILAQYFHRARSVFSQSTGDTNPKGEDR